MSFTSITVTGTYKDEAGNALSGTVEFRLSTTLVDGSGDRRTPVLVSCALDGSGHFSTSLIATDDPTTLPTGAGYHVREYINGALNVYDITVPYNSSGGTLDLGKITPAVLTSPVTTYATLTDVNRLSTYDQTISVSGKPSSGQVVLRFPAPRSWQLPASLTGSVGSVPGTLPTATCTLPVLKNGVQAGQFTIDGNGTYAFTMASATSFAAGDVLTVTAPSPADATLADFAVTLKGVVL